MKRHLLGFFAMALLCSATAPVASAQLLAVDVNSRPNPANDTTAPNPPNTVPGFESWTITSAGSGPVISTGALTLASGYTISAVAVDDGFANDGGDPGDSIGVIEDRDRTTPTSGFPLAQIYDDFIFAATSTGLVGGIDVTINSGGNLLPTTRYEISIWAYDSGSGTAGGAPNPRTARWLDGNNADALVLNTAFNAAPVASFDNQYKFTGNAMTDGSGNLLLKGRNTTAASSTTGAAVSGVFLNALTIRVPEPSSAALLAVGGVALTAVIRRRRQA